MPLGVEHTALRCWTLRTLSNPIESNLRSALWSSAGMYGHAYFSYAHHKTIRAAAEQGGA